MDVSQTLFSLISSPDVAYVLLIVGLISLVVAIGAPGTGVAEAAAAVCLVLALLGLMQLPLNWAGLLLMLFGVALFIVDLKVQSALLAFGGAIVLGIGSLLLFQPSPQTIGVSLWLVAAATLGTGAFFGYGLKRVREASRQAPKLGASALVGAHGVVRDSLTESNNLTGTAHIGGELWTVKAGRPIQSGREVVVEWVDGVALVVSEDDEDEDEKE